MGKVIMYEGYTPRQFSGLRPIATGAGAYLARQVARTCRTQAARGLTVGQALEQYDACMVKGMRERPTPSRPKSKKRSSRRK